MNSSQQSVSATSLYDRIQEALVFSRARWSCYADADHTCDEATLQQAYEDIHSVAETLSGGSRDAVNRAVVYYSIFLDSERNFMFPLIATHGSLWGVSHTLRIERGLDLIRPLSRHGRVQRWSDSIDAIRDINRRVFVEIYTTFYFTRFFGEHALAARFVNPEVLAVYNAAHDAIRSGLSLTRAQRREGYYTVFVHEQNDIVDPGIQEATQASKSWILVTAFSIVRPRFLYFPEGECLHFSDFTSVDQRNREGLRALDFAEDVGAERVLQAIEEYPLFHR